MKLAEFLDTSTDYLLGLTNDPTPIKYMNKDKLTEIEKKIVNLYTNLAEEDKIKLIQFLNSLTKVKN